MAEHVPASVHFTSLTYTLNSHLILDSISGPALPGQVMAIMGASGSGKSTFLDILARKNKRGQVKGETRLNGREVGDEELRGVAGFVDQEDTLMGTLTVYESVLYTAVALKLAIITIECYQDPSTEMRKVSLTTFDIPKALIAPQLYTTSSMRSFLPSTSFKSCGGCGCNQRCRPHLP